MAKHTVSFRSDDGGGAYIYINGLCKGHISSGAERYVSVVTSNDAWTGSTWQDRVNIARFKYRKPMVNAKEFCKVVFTALDVKTVVHLIKTDDIAPRILQKRIEDGETFLAVES